MNEYKDTLAWLDSGSDLRYRRAAELMRKLIALSQSATTSIVATPPTTKPQQPSIHTQAMYDEARHRGWNEFSSRPPLAFLIEPQQPAVAELHWTAMAFSQLGYVRDKMSTQDVTTVQDFLYAAAPKQEGK